MTDGRSGRCPVDNCVDGACQRHRIWKCTKQQDQIYTHIIHLAVVTSFSDDGQQPIGTMAYIQMRPTLVPK